MRGEQEGVVRALFGPKPPCRIKKKGGKGPSGIDLGDFLDQKGAYNSTDHAGQRAGGGDFPIDGVTFPARDRAGQRDGNDKGQGSAHGNVIGDSAKQRQCGNDQSPSPDSEAARGEARKKADQGIEKGAHGHQENDSRSRRSWQGGREKEGIP